MLFVSCRALSDSTAWAAAAAYDNSASTHPLATLLTNVCSLSAPADRPEAGSALDLPRVLCLKPNAFGSCAGDLAAALPRAWALHRWAPVLTRRV